MRTSGFEVLDYDVGTLCESPYESIRSCRLAVRFDFIVDSKSW